MRVVRFCSACEDYEERDIPINSAQLYDWMSGTPIEIAAKNLTEEDMDFLLFDEGTGWHKDCGDGNRGFGWEVGSELEQKETIH